MFPLKYKYKFGFVRLIFHITILATIFVSMKKHLFILCLLWFTIANLYAQKIVSNTLSFDSTAFVAIRKELNSMDAGPFAKLSYEANRFKLPYRLLAPQKLKTGSKYPLIIALHNSTRLGNDRTFNQNVVSRRNENSVSCFCFGTAI